MAQILTTPNALDPTAFGKASESTFLKGPVRRLRIALCWMYEKSFNLPAPPPRGDIETAFNEPVFPSVAVMAGSRRRMGASSSASSMSCPPKPPALLMNGRVRSNLPPLAVAADQENGQWQEAQKPSI